MSPGLLGASGINISPGLKKKLESPDRENGSLNNLCRSSSNVRVLPVPVAGVVRDGDSGTSASLTLRTPGEVALYELN